MPFLDLALATAQDVDELGLATALTELVATRLGKKREVTAVTVRRVAQAGWYIGGVPLAAEQAAFHLDVKITAGTNTKDEKARFLEDAFAQLSSHLGALQPASYVVLHELPADAWGYGGQTQEMRYIRGKGL